MEIQARSRATQLLLGVGLALFLFGTAIVYGWNFTAWIGGSRLGTTEFPLGNPHDVAVDSHGRIYLAEGFSHRIQRYSPKGQFELGWFVPTAGLFGLRTAPDDRVQVATERSNKLLVYSSDGQLLSSERYRKEYEARDFISETETTGGYTIRNGILPRVIEMHSGRTVISTSWPKRLIAYPFPAVAYNVLGLSLIVLSNWRRGRST